MITASADQITTIIAGDMPLLAEMRAFIDRIDDEIDFSIVLRDMAVTIASFSPFKDEADMAAVVHRETLRVLHGLTLCAMSARGTA
jgi:hypothetical protein